MNKHTPGTWTQAPHSPTDIVVDGNTMVATAREGLNGITRDQAIANARLIAAAPLMLEALQQIASKDYGNAYAKGCADIARAAIAAAIGDAA